MKAVDQVPRTNCVDGVATRGTMVDTSGAASHAHSTKRIHIRFACGGG